MENIFLKLATFKPRKYFDKATILERVFMPIYRLNHCRVCGSKCAKIRANKNYLCCFEQYTHPYLMPLDQIMNKKDMCKKCKTKLERSGIKS